MARSSCAVLTRCVLPVLVIVLGGCGNRESPTERSLRKAALANPRPVEGRLSVADRFARWDKSSSAHQEDPDILPEDKDQRVLRGSRPGLGEREPEELHRRGLLRLYGRQAARAVAELEAAAERKPSAAILSDLAAAYLALAEEDRPWLRVDALAAATRAVQQAPEASYAAFNRALALERLSLSHEAILAWEHYLVLEKDGDWSEEGAEHLARLRELTTADHWKTEKDRVALAAAAGDWATLGRLARQYPRETKDLIETELFPAWADAVGTPAERPRLAEVKQVAEVLANTGERLYADAVRIIETRADASQALADGHRSYARGLVLRGDCSQAMPEFERALEGFSAGGSPLAQAARFQQLVCVSRRSAPEAEEPLAELASELQGRPYPTLQARTEMMRGRSAMTGGRHSQAIAHYEQAVRLLRGISDTDVRRLYGMLDEAYRFLGDRDSAWRYRLEALQSAVAAGDRQIRHAVLAGMARDLTGGNRREAARAVLDEMIANARAWEEPGAEAEALLRRIQLHLLSGANDRAAADIAACARLLNQYQQAADREHLETELMVASAEQQLATNPTEALKVIETAVPRLESGGDGLILPRALLVLARAQVSLGKEEAAQDAFDQALQIYEARREGTVGEGLRISFFSTAQASFDAMIRFQALDRGDAQTAFAYSEQVRARALRDRVMAGKRESEKRSLEEQLDRIPANVAVIAYTVLPEKLLVWCLRQGSLKMHVLPATRSEVAETVESLRAALIGARSEEAGKAAVAKAFDVLLRPAIKDVPAETELVFMPDRELHQVPFSALFNTERGRYVIEDYTCVVVPSLEIYLASQERRTLATPKPRRVLAVGDPTFDTNAFPTLLALPYARKEAETVAGLYQDATLLIGEDATRQRILDAIPGTDVLHLAAHAVVDPRNAMRSLVATADLGHAPLRASDLNAERLASVDLVFLAACDTAPGFTDGDREGIAGFARTFLGSGVPSVVATLWAVDDQAAARFTEVFHARIQEGKSPTQALRFSQVAVLSETSPPAPFAWVPFQLFLGL